MTDFLSRLGIYTEPNEKEPPPPKALEQQVHQVTREAEQTKMHFTPRDFDTLELIRANPIQSPSADIEYCEVSNAKLAKLLGMTAGAAAARVARLVKMGVVKPWYEVAVETGKVNRRVLQVIQVPPAPWSPDGS